MGCCLSKSSSSSSESVARRRDDSPRNSRIRGGVAPPPPVPLLVEEETVKEVVLSETTVAKPPSPAVEKVNAGVVKWPENREFKVDVSPAVEKINAGVVRWPENREFKVDEIKPREAVVLVKPAEDIVSEVSEQTELCSFTESFSTTTTTTATALEKRDDGEEVTQRSPVKYRRKRPNTGDMVSVRERNVRSPARRALPSPEKRRAVMSSRPVQGRAMNAQRRNTGPPNGLRRDSGEGSARRSRSPVTLGEVGTRRNVRYKSPSLGENGKPGGRSPSRAVVENGGKVERQNDTVRENREMEKQNDDASPGNGESLENPLVSLECFIFL